MIRNSSLWISSSKFTFYRRGKSGVEVGNSSNIQWDCKLGSSDISSRQQCFSGDTQSYVLSKNPCAFLKSKSGYTHTLTDKIHVQFSSVAQLCPPLCDPMDCSTPGLPVHCQLPEFIQTHAHWVRDAIQPSCPLSSPFPPAWWSFPTSGSFPKSQLFV